MVKNILKRYEEAKEFIKHSTEEQFEEDLSKVRNKLDTLTRAYLESASDYMNPMLREIHKTEKLLKSMMKLVSHNHRNLKFKNWDCTNPHKTKYNTKTPKLPFADSTENFFCGLSTPSY